MMTLLHPDVTLLKTDWLDFYDVDPEMIPYCSERKSSLSAIRVKYIWTQVYTVGRGVEIYQGRFTEIKNGSIEGYYIAAHACDKGECENIVVRTVLTITKS